jgi:hypothetical protein
VRHAASTGRSEVNTKFSWGNLKEQDHLEDLDVDVSIIIKSNLIKTWDGKAWPRLIWLWTGLICGLL